MTNHILATVADTAEAQAAHDIAEGGETSQIRSERMSTPKTDIFRDRDLTAKCSADANKIMSELLDSHEQLETEAERLSNGYHNILAEFEKAPGLPLETLSQDDLAKWTDIITGILKALGPFAITGKPISLSEYLDAALEPK